MPKVHVVDRFKNEIIPFASEKDIELCHVLDCKKHLDAEGEPKNLMMTIVLDNGTTLYQYNNGFDVITDKKRVVYAPVYDVETCQAEGYSMYESEDILGYVNRHYNCTEYFGSDE